MKHDSLKDYYAILGVAINADESEIRFGYRRMAKRYHPDVAQEGQDYAERFRQINEAYSILGNAERRKEYDKERKAVNDPRWVNFEEATVEPEPEPGSRGRRKSRSRHRRHTGSHSAGNTAKNEWLDETGDDEWDEPETRTGLFGKVFGYTANQTRPAREIPDPRYGDLETEVLVTLNEVVNGVMRVINLRRKGTSERPRQHSIEIPKGVPHGHVLRLKGKGRTSLSRGTTGDLFVTVRYAPHPDFRLDGFDLHHEMQLQAWQLVLGDAVKVPTVDGAVQAKVPAGSVPGQRLRLRQHGLPRSESDRGDLVVRLGVCLPRNLTVEERRVWEQLRDLELRNLDKRDQEG